MAFVMGEGSGMLLLEDEAHARQRGARVYAELVGYATHRRRLPHHRASAQGRGPGARHPPGADQGRCESATQVQYVNAHGTATVYNDRNETAALKTVFGDHAKKLAISSTKSMVGHTLGAAGAIEGAATALTIANGIITPTINYEHPDPECDLDYVPNDGARGQGRDRHLEFDGLRWP